MIAQIVGSKPNAFLIPEASYVFFANGSIHLLNSGCDKIIILVTGSNITKADSINREKVLETVRGKSVRDLYLIDFKEEGVTANNLKTLDICYENLTVISRKQKKYLERKHTNTIKFFFYILLCPNVDLYSRFKTFVWCLRKNERKISTGLFSAVLCLENFNVEKIVISGIGFGNEDYHWLKQKSNKKRAHYVNDYAFIKAMKLKYRNVSYLTTEIDLHKLFKIPLYK